jgi:hypothetical protein
MWRMPLSATMLSRSLRDSRGQTTFALQGLQLQRLADGQLQLVAVERLADVMEGPRLHGLHGRFDGPEGCEDDDLDAGVKLSHLFHHLQAIHAGHPDIREDEIRALLPQKLQALLATGGGQDGVTFLGEVVLQDPPQAFVIVDDEDLDPLHPCTLPSTGRVMTKVVPLPG